MGKIQYCNKHLYAWFDTESFTEAQVLFIAKISLSLVCKKQKQKTRPTNSFLTVIQDNLYDRVNCVAM